MRRVYRQAIETSRSKGEEQNVYDTTQEELPTAWLQSPEVEVYDIEESREKTRSRLALMLVVVLLLVITLSVLTPDGVVLKEASSGARNLLDKAFSLVSYLLAVVVGFYFGQKPASQPTSRSKRRVAVTDVVSPESGASRNE
jgi:hypothetical protein